MTDFRIGIKDGLPIGLGYFTISIAFGIFVVGGGLSPLYAIVISFTNRTSSGQFAGLSVILNHGSYIELIVTVLLVNLRYLLMSFSLSQKISPEIGSLKRMLMSHGVTDEIFAVASRHNSIGFRYFLGLMCLPLLGWTGGTALGAVLGSIFPKSVQAAFGIMLYAMFVAIIIPPAKSQKVLRVIIIIAVLLSTALHLLPYVKTLQAGWKIIISTVFAAGVGATLFPIEAVENSDERSR